MKKLFILSSALLINSCYAEHNLIIEKHRDYINNYLKEKNMEAAGGGIKIVPRQTMHGYNNMENEIQKIDDDISAYGYINDVHPSTNTLLNAKSLADEDYKNPKNQIKPSNTHLKHNISEIKMAYAFKGVPEDSIKESLGYAPYLTYIKNQGWVGAIQLFTALNNDNCAYYENNTKLSLGSAVLAQEDVIYSVNDKATIVEVIGNNQSGFTYTIEWYDHTFFHKLECASKLFDENKKQFFVNLASKIDSYNI